MNICDIWWIYVTHRCYISEHIWNEENISKYHILLTYVYVNHRSPMFILWHLCSPYVCLGWICSPYVINVHHMFTICLCSLYIISGWHMFTICQLVHMLPTITIYHLSLWHIHFMSSMCTIYHPIFTIWHIRWGYIPISNICYPWLRYVHHMSPIFTICHLLFDICSPYITYVHYVIYVNHVIYY